MSNWTALNIEPAEAVEEEVDDTKEIQIEESLKLYQNALKLHSQGPRFYDQAAEAYDALLNSEIFKYPESLSGFKRAALQDSVIPPTDVLDDSAAAVEAEALTEYDINDSTSSTLLQTIYLAYKNHGQYVLDSLRSNLENTPNTPDNADEISSKIAQRASAALLSFADALESDDTDLNLWRQSARLSSALQSYRLVRYCLESVLADDENRLEVRTEQLGLEETFAEERLRNTLRTLDDRLSASYVPIKKPKKALLKILKRHIDPFPYLPALPNHLQDADKTKRSLALQPSRHEIQPTAPTWTGVGQSLLEVLEDEEQGSSDIRPGSSIKITLPPVSREVKATEAKDAQPSKQKGDEEDAAQEQEAPVPDDGDQVMKSRPPISVKTEGPDSIGEHADDHSSVDQRAEQQLMEGLELPSPTFPEADSQQEPANAEEPDLKSSVNGGRKRSSASAMTEDQAEGSRSKSRRTRLRESNADLPAQSEEVAFDQNKYYEDQLAEYIQADEWMLGTVGSLLSKVGVEKLGTVDGLRKLVFAEENAPADAANLPTTVEQLLPQDLRNIMKSWDEGRSQVMLQSDNFSTLQNVQTMGKSGLAIFLEHSRKSTRKLGMKQVLSGDEELLELSNHVNQGWYNVHEVVFGWLYGLLAPEFGKGLAEDDVSSAKEWPAMKSAYDQCQWPESLKETVTQALVRDDEYVYGRMCEKLEALEHQILSSSAQAPFEYTIGHFSDLGFIQTAFELHLDIYTSINNPNSEVDSGIRSVQRDRLARWNMLARTSLTHLMDHGPPGANQDNITLRHIWASTFYSNMITDASREHVLLCLQELKRLLHCFKDPEITLVNNAMMPEIAAEAIDQEISKLKSMDFFMKIFNPESEDPVGLIETIEPILEPSSVCFVEENGTDGQSPDQPTSQIQEMGSFLDRGDVTLRLFLWQRLQDAYKSINYPPKIISCQLRSIETITRELQSPAHLEEPTEHRQTLLIRWFKSLDGILSKTTTAVLQDKEKAFDCFDMDHLKSSMSALAFLLNLLHSFIVYEDSVRVGQTAGSDLRGALAKSLENFKDKLRDMNVRCWILLYTLLREAMAQSEEDFDTPQEDRIHYLRAVHNALGIRKMCKRSQKQFLKIMKSEIFTLDVKQDVEADECQILYDIHGIKLSPVDGLLAEHNCPVEKLDRSTAIMMIDFVMKQAKKINIKDLSKSELKATIDKMQSAIGTTKSSPPLTYNKRVLSSYLKSPLNPTEIFHAIRGVDDLPLIPVSTESAVIARKGWYFLLGHAALTKFRSQKRLNPVPTTDLDDAITWFRQDIEHGTPKWETWYRLAQTYDSKLEEDITWSADKINNNRTDLVTWQRNAIHCYAMAIATAISTADPTPETRTLLADVYTDFGIRLYASSREPLSMAAFNIGEATRHFNSEENQQMYERQPFKEMKIYSVWSLASFLLKHAIINKPKNWMTYYMRSKCLWKMYSCDDSVRGNFRRIEVDEMVDSLLDAIDALPQRRDSRSDPIFEPHYKLVSIIDKLVQRNTLTVAEASKTLLATPWARKVEAPEGNEDWKPYILKVLRNLKHGDKSNWHHRMAFRAAHILYDDQKDATAAAAAKTELGHQIFTKTMTIQVWRPEFERPGRHFVYTTRYVYFYVALLDQLDDRANLDQLLRRVRKKQGDFINHTKLWEDVCLTYARVIRRAGGIEEGHEESVFKPIGWDEFVTNTARLEGLAQLVPESTLLLELLRDAIELKKLNNNLMKVSLLEDLIADLYSRLYEVNMPQVLEQANEENKEKMKVDHLLMATTDGAADGSTPPTSAPPSEAPAPRGRTKGIARRDIQKRAETIVSRKLTPRAPAAKAPAPAETEQAPQHNPPKKNGATSAPSQTPKDTTATTSHGVQAVGSSTGHQSDAPDGSLHESADDESELSEIDDEKLSKLAPERKRFFPNLQDRGSVEPGSEMSAQVSADGDGGVADEAEAEVAAAAVGDKEGDAGENEQETGPVGEEDEEEGEDDGNEEEGEGEEGGDEAGDSEGEDEEGEGEDAEMGGEEENDIAEEHEHEQEQEQEEEEEEEAEPEDEPEPQGDDNDNDNDNENDPGDGDMMNVDGDDADVDDEEEEGENAEGAAGGDGEPEAMDIR